MKTKSEKKKFYKAMLLPIVLCLIGGLLVIVFAGRFGKNGSDQHKFRQRQDKEEFDVCLAESNQVVIDFAKAHNLDLHAWPNDLIRLLEDNPDTTEFVLHYPLKKDGSWAIDLSECAGSGEVPLLLQWDERWGYSKYAGEIMGLSGCAPTCLSMVCIYLLDDGQYTPRYIADFAQQEGYCVLGNGSTWTLISEGGKALGLDVIEIPLDKNRIISNLEAGNPIVCVMGPGDFTSTGHFIVMADYVDGKIKVNDPNSPTRSNMLWDYDVIKDQVRNLWVCR